MGACSSSAAAMAACDAAQPLYCAAREGRVPGSRSLHCLRGAGAAGWGGDVGAHGERGSQAPAPPGLLAGLRACR